MTTTQKTDRDFNHVMIDFETLGLRPDAVILSIGAVHFDPWSTFEDTCIKEKFYMELDAECQVGRTRDQNTIDWWKTQPGMPNGSTPFFVAFGHLNQFLFDLSPVMLWAQGADFDFPKLDSCIIDHIGLKPAYKYNSKRDLRTLIALIPGVTWPENPQKHNALEDAICQAKMAHRCMKKLTGEFS